MDMEYIPSHFQYIATGTCGVMLYLFLIINIISAYYRGVKNYHSKIFFKLLMIMCLLELPRYLVIAILKDYNSRVTYVLHIIASTIYFSSFSVVCYQWSGLLQLGMFAGYMYSLHGLIIANIIFGLFDCIAIGYCLQSTSLTDYFQSIPYAIYIITDTLKSIIYSILLSYYGIKLILKFHRYNKIEINNGNNIPVFGIIVYRITFVLIISTICYILRITMLIIKLLAVHSDYIVTTKYFPLFGILWFTCSDFIPRILPSYAFIYIMKNKNKKSVTTTNNTNISDVRLLDNASDVPGSNPINGVFKYNNSFGDSFDYVSENDGINDDIEDTLALYSSAPVSPLRMTSLNTPSAYHQLLMYEEDDDNNSNSTYVPPSTYYI
jgi:hypothetical protein